MEIILRMACAAMGYVFGNFLTAELVAEVAGKRVSEIGTGNPGMANIMANVGKKAGFLVLAGDSAKTVLAAVLAFGLAGSRIGITAVLYAGIGAVCGHNYPLPPGRKGGKGVTVTCVWLACCLGLPGILCSIAGGIVVLIWRSLALGAAVIPVVAVPLAFWLLGMEGGLLVLLSAVIMINRHLPGLREFFVS